MVSAEMRAAGGVVWRERAEGTVEVVLVHRPGHDDWSLPKGKAEPGEGDREAAVREVEEETGVRPRVGQVLATVRYLDRDGRRKAVRYWAMEPEVVGRHEPDHEIDQVEWLALPEARARLTYSADQAVLDALERRLGRLSRR
jgi:8-oxo-dGTP pyrophosphatase MutT (NUDIX family)